MFGVLAADLCRNNLLHFALCPEDVSSRSPEHGDRLKSFPIGSAVIGGRAHHALAVPNHDVPRKPCPALVRKGCGKA